MINALTVQMEETRAKVSSVGDVESLRNKMDSSRAEITTLQSEIGVLKKAVGSSNTDHSEIFERESENPRAETVSGE